MDATALGALLVGVGGLASAVVAFMGKRGENAIAGYSSLTGDLRQERQALKEERDALRLQLAELHAQRAADQAELAHLRGIITTLGGDSS
ncbi:hypothetical protein OHB04_22890 [Streptomyces sp. NBC_01775]|uniref:hypothetical protein n=1 Tax=Streptomyces sp. NBC_01775 TaxID=2975939 RepID=UPI002DDC7FC5|nr:hypothetical protein [Streptomyces sp. NBC_01775]WSB78341.1 hypothetical protein OHB04_22890 [Streptomyces sp. NBC_01775]